MSYTAMDWTRLFQNGIEGNRGIAADKMQKGSSEITIADYMLRVAQT